MTDRRSRATPVAGRMNRPAPHGAARLSSPRHRLAPRRAGATWARLATLLVIAGSVGLGVVRNGLPTLSTAQSWAADFGWWAPLLFVLLYAAATVSLLPMTVLSAFAGTLFGIPGGIAVVWCGAMLGSTAAFLLGGGRTRGAEPPPVALGRWHGLLQRHGTWAILVTRLVPVVPLGLVNYAFAVTPVHLRQYLVGTGIGIIPVTVVLVTLGDQATSLRSPWSMIAAAALVALLAVVAVLVKRRWIKSTHNSNHAASPSANENTEDQPR